MAPIQDEYLLHCISNAQPDLFANKANHFKTSLSETIDLPVSEKWQIGLSEFGYLNNVDTVVNMTNDREHSLTIGQISNSELLGEYLPNFLCEGGSHAKKYFIFSNEDKSGSSSMYINPVDCFKRTLSSNLSLQQSIKLYHRTSLYYIGSDGVTPANDVIYIGFKGPTYYQSIVPTESYANYALIFSSTLAQILQLEQCIFMTFDEDEIEIKTKLSAAWANEHYNFLKKFPFDECWFSILPLHRCNFTKRSLVGPKLGDITPIQFLNVLEWNDIGKVYIKNSKEASFVFNFDGITGISYSVLKQIISNPACNVTLDNETSLQFPSISVNNPSPSEADTKAAQKREKERVIVEDKIRIQQKDEFRKRLSALRQQRNKIRKHYYTSLKHFNQKTRRQIPWKYKGNRKPMLTTLSSKAIKAERKWKSFIKKEMESLSSFNQTATDYHSYYTDGNLTESPAFIYDIPTHLDILEYLDSLESLLDVFNTNIKNNNIRGYAKIKWEKDLQDWAKENSLQTNIFFFVENFTLFTYCKKTKEECLKVHKDDTSKFETNVIIQPGFYTLRSWLKTLIKTINDREPDAHLALKIDTAPTGLRYTLTMKHEHTIYGDFEVVSPYFDVQTVSRDKIMKGKMSYISGRKHVKTVPIPASTINLTTESVLHYISIVKNRIDNQVPSLDLAANRGNHLLHLKRDYSFVYYPHHDRPVLSNNANNNLLIGMIWDFDKPFKITIPQGFYTPFSLTSTINSLLPFDKLYWFNIHVNDPEYYSIEISTTVNGYIVFETGWSDLFLFTDPKKQEAFKTLIENEVRNGSVLKFPTLYNRTGDYKRQAAPYSDIDILKTRPETHSDDTPIQAFMRTMFASSKRNISYSQEELESNFNAYLKHYDKQFFYFMSGQRLTINVDPTYKKWYGIDTNLCELRIPFTEEPDCIHLFSSAFRPPDGELISMLKNKNFLHPFQTINIPQGKYTVESLVEYVNTRIHYWIPDINITVDANKYLHITTGQSHYIMLDTFKHLLGIDMEFVGPDTTWVSPTPVNIVPNSYNLIIYCNLVCESFVGGQREQILRIFPTRGNNLGEMISETMPNIDYYDLYQYKIKDNEIKFYGDDGTFMKEGVM